MKPAVAPWERPLYCMRIVCQNGTTVRLVEYPHDVEIGGNTYQSDTGYNFTGVKAGTSFAPGVVDLRSFLGLSENITLPNIMAGIFDRAAVFVFVTDWANPVEDEEPIMKAIFGKVNTADDKYTAEIMSLIDLLNTSVGDSYSASCSLVFGGQEFGGCKVDATALQETGTLTNVTDGYTFADSTRTEDDDYFGAGRIWFTTGDNTGIAAQRVKEYTSAGGIITTTEPFPFPPQVGDAYVLEPGCRKRLEDCRDKFDNVARRRGFDWIPGTRFLNKVGGTK